MSTKLDVIAGALRSQINGGVLPPGARLPTVSELATAHGVARSTVQEALSILRSEGLIITQRGRTALVAPQTPLRVARYDRYDRVNREAPDGSTTFEREIRAARGWHARVVYLNVGDAHCPEWAAAYLEVAPGEPVLERARLRLAAPSDANGMPDPVLERVAEIFTSYLPLWVADAVPAVRNLGSCGKGGSTSRMEEAGIDLGEVPDIEFVNETRPTTPEETALLGFDRPVPKVQVEDRVWYDTQGRIVTVDRSVSIAPVKYIYRSRRTSRSA